MREVWRSDLQERAVHVSRPGEPACAPRLVWHPREMPRPLALDLRTIFGRVEGRE